MKKLIFTLFLVPIFATVFADIAIEGEVTRLTRITNLSDFPDYEFFIKFQAYYYDMGYQAGELTDTPVFEDSLFRSGGRGSTSFIYARRKSDGTIFQSEKAVGGQKIVSQRGADGIEDLIKIKSLEDGEIKFKIQESILHYRNGKTEKISKSGITGISMFGFDIAYVGFPLLCALALVFFFMRRRRNTST